MSTKFKVLLAVVGILAAGCSPRPPLGSAGRWVDLTHAFSSKTLYWPTAEPFRLEPEFHGTTARGYHYEANRYQASEHGGTHLDAPNHFAEGGLPVEQIPLDRLIGPAVVVDVSARALRDPDYRIGLADFVAFEKAHGPIPPDTIVLLHTGYGRFWPDPLKYLGTAERGAEAVAGLHFPGLDPAAAEWLAEARKIKAVGLDTASIDPGQAALFESHRVLARHRIPIFENLAGLAGLPATGATVVALPMKIEGGSGAPLRLVAWVPGR